MLFRKRHADADLPAGLILLNDKRLSCLRIFTATHFNMRKSMKYFCFIGVENNHFFTVTFRTLSRY